MLVSNRDYSNNRLGEAETELVINSPFFYGGVPEGINVSVLEVRNPKITLWILFEKFEGCLVFFSINTIRVGTIPPPRVEYLNY